MTTIDNAVLFDIFHARLANIPNLVKPESYDSMHNQLGVISHRVDRAIENIDVGSPRPRVGVPMHEGEI